MLKALLICALCSAKVLADPTTVRYAYNSSDLSYLSNGIQFPVALSDIHGSLNIRKGEEVPLSEMEFLSNLYDHFAWSSQIDALSNEECKAHVHLYLDHLKNSTSWATKMYDASGRYTGQFLFGNDYWLGSYSLCLELANEKYNKEVPPFPVYFYVAKVRININKELTPVTRQLNLGECLPKSCTPSDVRTILAQERTDGSSLNIVGIRPVPGDYNLFQDIKFQIIGGCVIVMLLLIIVSSLVEYIIGTKRSNKVKDDEAENNNNNNSKDDKAKRPNHGIALRLLLAFSAVNNGKKILNVSSNKDSISCIHGLRFFSIAWIILVHTYLEIFSIADNKTMRILTERTFMYQTISNATFSVDTFFFISGLLVTLTYFRTDAKAKAKTPTKELKPAQELQKSFFKFLIMLLYRFLRLTPAYLFVLGVNEIILRYLHSFSVFSPAVIDHITCDQFWWRNALYINNFYPQHEFCMLWSWYIANDTQFFVIASVLLLIAVKGGKYLKFAAVAIGALLLASWIATFTIAMKYDFVARVEEPFALFDQLYDKPWLRIGPYLVGMVTGYFMFKVNCKVTLTPPIVAVGWILSLACLGLLVYCLGRDGLVIPASAFWAALGHTFWGLSLAWITIACCSGYGGPFNSFFSCKLFLPLSRLSYCAYLIHPVLMFLSSFILDGPIHLHNVFAVVIYSGNVVTSFLFAFLISLFFEAPVVNLLKIIF